MLIIWQRWGPLGLIFAVLGFLLSAGVGWILRWLFGLDPANSHWTSVVGLVVGFGVGALANWLFAVHVVEPRLDRLGTDSPAAPSTLFFLPLRYWTFGILVIGVVFLVPNLATALTE